ncbi:MAG: alpha/beta fold hydrolase, partial [Rhizobiaceae bacterium]
MVGAGQDILFVQGGGAGTHDKWDDKLVASLRQKLSGGYIIRYPRMPTENDPSFATWSTTLEQEIASLSDGAILVGHSIGGTILIHTLAERLYLLKGIAAICLVAAPFIGDGGWHSDDIRPGPGWPAPLADVAVYLYHGDADDIVPIKHLDLYGEALPKAQLRCLDGRDHQLNNDLSEIAQDI